MKNGNWIKLHRKLKDNPLMGKPAYRSLWIEILLQASFDDRRQVMFNGKQKRLKPGEFTTGAYKLASETGIPRGTVERILKRFKSEEMIEVQTDGQCSLITVLKWSSYQHSEEASEERVRNDRGTGEERVRTNKELKNIRTKELKNIAATSAADIKKVFEKFQMTINPTINYGNKTQRKAAEGLIKKLGLERTLSLIEYCYEIRNDKFAPIVTTPYQLQEKLAHVGSYWNKDNNKPPNVVSI